MSRKAMPRSPSVSPGSPMTPEIAVDAMTGLLFPEEAEQEATQNPGTDVAPSEMEDTSGQGEEGVEDSAGEEAAEAPTTDAGESPEADPEAEPEAEPQPKLYTVRVDGKDLQVPEDELLKGYSRTADYTRKAQALAEQRKQAEAHAAEVQAQRAQYAELLGALKQAITDATPQEPDWQRLSREDPAQYATAREAWEQHRQRMAALTAEHTAAQQAVQADQQQALQRRVKEEQDRLVAAVPEWQQPDVFAKDATALVEYGRQFGLTPDDLAQVVDHRAILFMRKAMLYDAAQAQMQQRKQKLTAVTVAPGETRQAARIPAGTPNAAQRLAQTGRVEDAAAAIAALLPD